MLDIMAFPTVALIAWFWYLGGGKHAWTRDILIPIVVGLFICFKINIYTGILTAGFCQIIRMGYGSYDPINDDKPSFLAGILKDKQGWWIRAVCGFMYGAIAPLAIMFFRCIMTISVEWLVAYYSYIALNVGADFAVSRFKLNRLATDLIVGAVFGLIVFL